MKITAVLLLVVSALALAGCGESKSGEAKPAASGAAAASGAPAAKASGAATGGW